jgi:hypothetical protein
MDAVLAVRAAARSGRKVALGPDEEADARR